MIAVIPTLQKSYPRDQSLSGVYEFVCLCSPVSFQLCSVANSLQGIFILDSLYRMIRRSKKTPLRHQMFSFFIWYYNRTPELQWAFAGNSMRYPILV